MSFGRNKKSKRYYNKTMNDKRIRMYMIFWFAATAPKRYRDLSAYGISKSGDEFIRLAYAEQTDREYVDFDKVLKDFLEKCREDESVIHQLLNEVDGKFNIEIVPEISASSSTPSMVLTPEFMALILSLGNKFGYLEIDTYVI